jgi:D-alanyl-lipoteichoic acid acyltransferase DltB (MBOAT superfamily)
MLFTTIHWVVFLTFVFIAFHLAPAKWRRWVMLAASLYFYGSWSVPYLLLIFGQLMVDWGCGFLLGQTTAPRRRKLLVALSVVVNLGALCVFKYYPLIARTLAPVGLHLPALSLTLPLAISFYTFESMSYTIDVYRRRLEPVRSPIHLALFITWFPHLIAGPIIRPSELVPQLDQITPITRQRFFGGLSLMLVGYAKKLLGADWLATVAEPVFRDPGSYTSLELAIGVYAYAFQIYLDFSGYTDIARGASRWFGIELPKNFDAPYLATSVTDFWRRWHMTLSHWLRDYLYIPLGGNRLGAFRTYANLMVTMLLGGLWHGASWTFVFWGGLHGLALAVERALGVRAQSYRGPELWLRRIVTFHLVCLAWIFFRAPTFDIALQILRGLGAGDLRLVAGRLLPMLGALFLIGGYWAVAPLRRLVLRLEPGPSFLPQAALAVAAGIFLLGLMVFGASTSAFIYFQF